MWVEVPVELGPNVGRSVKGKASSQGRDNLTAAVRAIRPTVVSRRGTVIAVVPGLVLLLVGCPIWCRRLLAGHVRQRPDSRLVYHVCRVSRCACGRSQLLLLLLQGLVVVVQEGVSRVSGVEHGRSEVVQGGGMKERMRMSHRRSIEHFGRSRSTARPRL